MYCLEWFTVQDPVLAFRVPTVTCAYVLKDRLGNMLCDHDYGPQIGTAKAP